MAEYTNQFTVMCTPQEKEDWLELLSMSKHDSMNDFIREMLNCFAEATFQGKQLKFTIEEIRDDDEERGKVVYI